MSTIEQTAHERLSKVLQRNEIEFQDTSNANDATMSVLVKDDKDRHLQIYVPNAMFVIDDSVEFNTYQIIFNNGGRNCSKEFRQLDGVISFLNTNH